MSDSMQLLQRCREGEISAVDRLIQTQHAPLFRLAYSLLLHSEAANRAVQEALLAAIYTPGRKRADESFDTWLGGLCVHACLDSLNASARARTIMKDAAPVEPAEVSAPLPGARPMDATLWATFLRLSPELRVGIVLRYFHDHNLDITARMLHVGKSTASSRLSEARDQLIRAMHPDPLPPEAPVNEGRGYISHTQARLLLQSSMDEPLSTQEWVPLQSHLDDCDSCREYRKHLQGLERDLHRVLRPRLETAKKPPFIDSDLLLERQRKEMRRRSIVIISAKVLGVIAAILVGLMFAFNMFTPPSASNDPARAANLLTATPAPTPTAALAVPFRAPVLFQSSRDGNNEIYMVDPNGQATNLTEDPGEDLAPTWSPDGEWIAFLSSRSGKNEVYVMRVSGTQITRLTDEPEVTWQGPISWAADGKTLALTGAWSADNGRTWVYLVSIDGGNQPVRLSSTNGARSPHWAPRGDWIAYEQRVDGRNLLFGRKIDSNNIITLTTGLFGTGDYRAPFSMPDSAFGWTQSGSGLVYVTHGPYNRIQSTGELQPRSNARSRILISSYSAASGLTGNVSELHSAPLDQAIVGASSSPGGLLAYLYTDSGACAEGLFRLNIAPRGEAAPGYAQPTATTVPVTIPQICAALPIDETAWTQDGRWLVLNATLSKDEKPALYALDVLKTQSDLFYNQNARLVIVKLTDAPGADSFPQARPQAPLLGISPRAVIPGARVDLPLPPTVTNGLKGQIIFSTRQSGNSEIITVLPNGIGRRNLTFTQSDNILVPSNDGREHPIVFISNRGTSGEGPGELFLMDANGSNIRQITGTAGDPRPNVTLSYRSAPAWSPDGSTLAIYLFTRDGLYLAFLPADGDQARYRYVFLGSADLTTPFWASDGSRVMFLKMTKPFNFVQVTTAGNITSSPWDGFGDAQTISAAIPMVDNQLAVLTVGTPNANGDMPMDLFTGRIELQSDGGMMYGAQRVAGFEQAEGLTPPELIAVPGRSEVIVKSDRPANARIKTTFTLVNTEGTGIAVVVENSEEQVFAQVVSPDGHHLLYASETGLWILSLESAVGGTAGPAKLLSEPITSLDWLP